MGVGKKSRWHRFVAWVVSVLLPGYHVHENTARRGQKREEGGG